MKGELGRTKAQSGDPQGSVGPGERENRNGRIGSLCPGTSREGESRGDRQEAHLLQSALGCQLESPGHPHLQTCPSTEVSVLHQGKLSGKTELPKAT